MAARRVCARRPTRPQLTKPEVAQTPPAYRAGFLFVRNLEPGTWRLEPGRSRETTMDYSKLDGLIPAVVQDHKSGEVLMVGFMNQEAWDVTKRTGYVTFFR